MSDVFDTHTHTQKKCRKLLHAATFQQKSKAY